MELLARANVEMALACMPIRQWVDEAKRAPIDLPKLAAKMVPTQCEAIHAAAAGCDAIVATGTTRRSLRDCRFNSASPSARSSRRRSRAASES